MRYKLAVTHNFDRGMRRLNHITREKARATLKTIQEKPYENKELRGRLKGLRSARFGDYRIVYAINEMNKTVVLIFVGPRERIYER
jgi:addiction module RelE/StbE family toxin